MNQLDDRQRELVALGAAMGSNCVPCIEYHLPEAAKAGLSASQISEAIEVADKVRQVPARKVLDAAQRKLRMAAPAGDATENAGCGQAAASPGGNSGCCSG